MRLSLTCDDTRTKNCNPPTGSLVFDICVMVTHTCYMPAKILPSRAELEKMLSSGMTHKEIAAAVSRKTGHPVRRSTVSAAIHRAGLSGAHKKYEQEIPWTVREKHLTHYAARMLRVLGRRRAGIQNSAEQDARLDTWLDQLRRERAVVVYLPNSPEGFYYIDGDWMDDDLPINPDFTEQDVYA